MKRITLVLLLLAPMYCLSAQTRTDLVFIGTSIDMPKAGGELSDGLYKLSYKKHKSKYAKKNSCVYTIVSQSQDWTLKLRHANFKKRYSKGRKDLQVIEIALQNLSKLGKLVDVDKFIATKSSDDINKWAAELTLGKVKIWVIDRRDIRSSSSDINIPYNLKAHECEIWPVDLPIDDVYIMQ
ncbi:MAG: hypothetical protein IJX65_06165 [Alistipes sp.]|nr:hypothetical protein [Alistipes sp.]